MLFFLNVYLSKNAEKNIMVGLCYDSIDDSQISPVADTFYDDYYYY